MMIRKEMDMLFCSKEFWCGSWSSPQGIVRVNGYADFVFIVCIKV